MQKFERLRERLAAAEAERQRLQADLATQKCREEDMVNTLRQERAGYQNRVEQLEAERDAARAGEARAVEAVRSVRGACDDVLTYCGPQQQEDIKAIMDCVDGGIYAHELGNGASWLAQQRAEAVEAERRSNTDAIRSLGPAFCDFFFGGPGEAEYLAGLLRQQRREAAAEALESIRIGWLSDNDYRPGIPEIWRYIADRAAAFRAGAEGGVDAG